MSPATRFDQSWIQVGSSLQDCRIMPTVKRRDKSHPHQQWLQEAVAAHSRGERWGIFPEGLEPPNFTTGFVIPYWIVPGYLSTTAQHLVHALEALAIASGTPYTTGTPQCTVRRIPPRRRALAQSANADSDSHTAAEFEPKSAEDSDSSHNPDRIYNNAWLIWEKSDVQSLIDEVTAISRALVENSVTVDAFLEELVGSLLDLAKIFGAERNVFLFTKGYAESDPRDGHQAGGSHVAVPSVSSVEESPDATLHNGWDELPESPGAAVEQGVCCEQDLLEALASQSLREDVLPEPKRETLTNDKLDESGRATLWALQEVHHPEKPMKIADSPLTCRVSGCSEEDGKVGAEKRKREPLQGLMLDFNMLQEQQVGDESSCKVARIGEVPPPSGITPPALEAGHKSENAFHVQTPSSGHKSGNAFDVQTPASPRLQGSQ